MFSTDPLTLISIFIIFVVIIAAYMIIRELTYVRAQIKTQRAQIKKMKQELLHGYIQSDMTAVNYHCLDNNMKTIEPQFFITDESFKKNTDIDIIDNNLDNKINIIDNTLNINIDEINDINEISIDEQSITQTPSSSLTKNDLVIKDNIIIDQVIKDSDETIKDKIKDETITAETIKNDIKDDIIKDEIKDENDSRPRLKLQFKNKS